MKIWRHLQTFVWSNRRIRELNARSCVRSLKIIQNEAWRRYENYQKWEFGAFRECLGHWSVLPESTLAELSSARIHSSRAQFCQNVFWQNSDLFWQNSILLGSTRERVFGVAPYFVFHNYGTTLSIRIAILAATEFGRANTLGVSLCFRRIRKN